MSARARYTSLASNKRSGRLGVQQPLGCAVNRTTIALFLFFVSGNVRPASGQELIAIAKDVRAASLDSTLPAVPLERWLAEVGGIPFSAIKWEINDCGEGGDGREAPTCIEAIFNLDASTSAHVSLFVTDNKGKRMKPDIWDLSVGAGLSFTGFKTLREWAAYVRVMRENRVGHEQDRERSGGNASRVETTQPSWQRESDASGDA
jgi:hypothetical protein